MQPIKPQLEKLQTAVRQFNRDDMRWSYWLALGLIALGIVLHFALAGGWVVWPFIFAAAGMSMVHEAADRNGQGVPPLHVYGFVLGVIAVWVIVVMLFSIVLNPVVIMVGIIALGYQVARGFLQERERNRVMEVRRGLGLCIFCGEPVEEKSQLCENCGNEPDPSNIRLRRVASIVNQRKDPDRARVAIQGGMVKESMSSREQALIARHRSRTGRK